MSEYIALIHKDPGSDYGVSFPDFPGCITAGATVDEARRMAEKALAFHIAGLVEDGEPVPQPSHLEDVMGDPENRDAVAIFVPARKNVRINITVPSDVLAEIDRYAEGRGLTRSDFLTEAARRALEAT
jgi:predicted RNase H-like HicB family nuclease